MEYYTYLWTNPLDEEKHILLKSDYAFGKIIQGRVLQNILKKELEIDNVIPIIVDPSGIHSVLVSGIPLNLTDEGLEELDWEKRTWGDNKYEK